MASATAAKQSVIKQVTLTLSNDEAETLLYVTRNIGGPADTTRRGHTDKIGEALRNAGVQRPVNAMHEGFIEFKKDGAPRVDPIADYILRNTPITTRPLVGW